MTDGYILFNLKLNENGSIRFRIKLALWCWWGEYPGNENWTSDATRWQGFQAGYNAADTQKAQERGERVHKEMEELVRESVKWCEEHPDKDPLDWLKPQTPEQVADGLKEAFREAVKQGVVSSADKPKKSRDALDDFMDKMVEELKGQTLRDVCMDWWDRVFGDTDDTETCIDNLVDEISLWLPKYQSAAGSQNAYVESAVEGFNDCLDKIRGKLR